MIQQSEILSQINKATRFAIGQDYFNGIGQIIQNVSQADYTFISRLDESNNAVPIVSIKHGALIENIEYDLNGTPCSEVSKTCIGYFPSNVQNLFPHDDYLKKTNVSGYIGASITTSGESSPFAIITCLYEKEPSQPKELLSAIKLISETINGRAEREYLLLENYELKKVHKKYIKKISHGETLLREIHHRVKNNLQIVASLLNLQKSKTSDLNVLDMINISKARIFSIALVHELLYNSEDFENVDIKLYIEKITQNIINRDAFPNLDVTIDVKKELVNLDTLIPCGLILCEGITNFVKHGINEKKPMLEIKFVRNINERVLIIKDNGPGFPTDILDGKYDSLGLELIQSLTQQINGSANLYNNGGAIVEVAYPV